MNPFPPDLDTFGGPIKCVQVQIQKGLSLFCNSVWSWRVCLRSDGNLQLSRISIDDSNDHLKSILYQEPKQPIVRCPLSSSFSQLQWVDNQVPDYLHLSLLLRPLVRKSSSLPSDQAPYHQPSWSTYSSACANSSQSVSPSLTPYPTTFLLNVASD